MSNQVDVTELSPKPPNPAYVTLLAALIRGSLQILSGIGLGWGAFVSGDQITMAAWATVSLLTFSWTIWQKFQAARRNDKTSVASAVVSAVATDEAKKPTPIVVDEVC